MNRRLMSFVACMLKTGLVGFGGGTALIPVIEHHVVKENKFISESEFGDDVSLASVTPGALPVELASGVGRRIAGIKGMFAGAFAIALPGVLMTVLILAFSTLASDNVIHQISYCSIGINAVVIFILIDYIVSTFKQFSSATEIVLNALAVCLIFILTGLKNIYKLVGLESAPAISFSTFQVFLMFFAICAILGIISWLRGRRIPKPTEKANSLKPVLPAWRTCIIMALIGAVILFVSSLCCEEGAAFAVRGFVSSLMSFGGGDAYLAIADGLFVEGDFITEEEFYGYLVPAVNVVPGSILCKTLSGMGFIVGFGSSGSMASGLLLALCSFACSIFASCVIFGIAWKAFDLLENLQMFIYLRKWVRTVISGLMLTVISSLVYQGISVTSSVSAIGDPGSMNSGIVVFMICIYALNLIMSISHIGYGKRFLISAAIAVVGMNIIL